MCDSDDGAGAGDTSGPDESNAFGTDPGMGISDPATGVSSGIGDTGDTSSDIGDAISATEAATMAASVAQAEEDAFGGMHTNAQVGQPGSFMTQGLLGLPAPFSFLDPTPMSMITSLALAPMGPLGTMIGLGMRGMGALGIGSLDQTAAEAVAGQEAATNDAGGDAGFFPGTTIPVDGGPLSPAAAIGAIGVPPINTPEVLPPGGGFPGSKFTQPNTTPVGFTPEQLAMLQPQLTPGGFQSVLDAGTGAVPPAPPLSPGTAFSGLPGIIPRF